MERFILEINSVCHGSTGNIMLSIAEKARENGFKAITAFQNSDNVHISDSISIGNKKSFHYSIFASYFTGLEGCFSFFATLSFLRKLKRKPDLIHLHNLHQCYINLPLLFNYIKKNNIPVVWTLHDCWAFTGHCPYYTLAKCDKWKTGCSNCVNYKDYPEAIFDNSKIVYALKKRFFLGVKNLTIVTPSQWLADQVNESFLGEYPIKVINNGIDLNIFKPTESNFKENHGIKNKYIILGVAFGWSKRKGIDVFVELSKVLTEEYQIVLVGTNDETDRILPKSIISIHRTESKSELAKIYSAADLFVNPTREDNFPTVNMEALACGTPVLTFRTGGSPEIIDDTSGSTVECNDIVTLGEKIKEICKNNKYNKQDCINRAKQFDDSEKYTEYVELFERIIKQ